MPSRRAHRARGRRGGGERRARALARAHARAWTRSTCSARTRARAGRRGHRGGAPALRRRTGSPGRSTSRRRARATVGGNIATNAGGVKVIRYGLTRQWVLGLAGGARERRGARAQRRAREEQHRRRSAPALHRQRGHARRHHRGDAQAHARCPASSTSSSSRCRDLAGVLALFREARRGAVHDHAPTSSSPTAASRACSGTASCARRSTQRRLALRAARGRGRATAARSRRGSASLFERGLVTDGTLAQHAGAGARALGAARGDQREPLGDRAAAQERHRAARSRRSRRSAPSSTRVFARALPGLGDLPLRPHRRRQPARQRDEARRRWPRTAFLAKTHGGRSRRCSSSCASTTGSISAEHGIGLLKKPYLGYSRGGGRARGDARDQGGARPEGHAQPGQGDRSVASAQGCAVRAAVGRGSACRLGAMRVRRSVFSAAIASQTWRLTSWSRSMIR